MQRNECGVLLSASDLMRFAGCAHATTLDLAWMMGRGTAPGEDSEDAELLQRHGDAHEARHLARLRAAGRSVVEIVKEGVSLAQGVAATRAALERGADVVFQGALAGGSWGGWTDFLERVERPSALGAWSYEVADTKLKRKPHPKHVLQLALYSDLLAEVQGVAPEHAHVELGDGTRATIRLADVSAYARRARRAAGGFRRGARSRPVRFPAPTARSAAGASFAPATWRRRTACTAWPTSPAGRWRSWKRRASATMAALAARREPVRGMADETLGAAGDAGPAAGRPRRRRAGVRAAAGRAGQGLRPAAGAAPGRHLLRHRGRSRTSRAGSSICMASGRRTGFRAIWAHDHAAERAALEAVLELFRARLAAHPGARIYHYAAYEITALRRLTALYGIGEAFLDRLLRERRFVDLYAVVRGGVIASEPDYSIKSLEVFTGIEREGEVKTAGGSVVAYERWREERDDAILDEIEDYNRIDCVSTEKLRDWLVGIRPAGPWPALAPGPRRRRGGGGRRGRGAAGRRSPASDLDPERQRLLFDLGLFHRREAKPA